MNLMFGVFGKKLILKHFMHRTIPKKCVLGVFWTAEYVSEVYFTWRRLLLTLLISFMGVTPLGVFIFYSHSKTKKFPFSNSYILWLCSSMVCLSISAKTQEMFILTWIQFFCFPITLVLLTYGPFSWSVTHIDIFSGNIDIYRYGKFSDIDIISLPKHGSRLWATFVPSYNELLACKPPSLSVLHVHKPYVTSWECCHRHLPVLQETSWWHVAPLSTCSLFSTEALYLSLRETVQSENYSTYKAEITRVQGYFTKR